MKLRDFALRIVQTAVVAEKLAPPAPDVDDLEPGPSLRLERPGRPPDLRIVPPSRAKVPSLSGMHDPAQRSRIVHALANHELQALELFAWALLAFPEAPPDYRRGLLRILADEQRHTRMYLACLERLGHRFGAFPVSGYFWNKIGAVTTPLRFVCLMSLTFENANLDHTEEYARAAHSFDDPLLARTLEQVQRDEIDHVRFGWRWLERLKEPSQSMWDAYRANVVWPVRPELARGLTFHVESRRTVGMDEDFIRSLKAHNVNPRPRRRSRRPSV